MNIKIQLIFNKKQGIMNKKSTLFIFALIFVNLFIKAQNIKSPNIKWGQPTNEEMKMTTYAHDPEADAVILAKTTKIFYKMVSGQLKEYIEVKCRIKILTNEGKEYANIFIPFHFNGNKHNQREVIESYKGTSFNLVNGKVVKEKVTKDMISFEDIDKTDRLMKMTIPKVEIGTIIEYEYTIDSDFYLYIRTWKAQEPIPVVYTTYDITIPMWFNFNGEMTGSYQLNPKIEQVNLSFALEKNNVITCMGKRYLFTGIDLPALKKEPYVFNQKIYGQKVDFEIIGLEIPGSIYRNYAMEWADVDKKLLDDNDFGGVMKKNLLKNEMQQAGIYDIQDRNEKINAIIRLLRSRVKWNEDITITGTSATKALKDGSANNTTLNLMLVAMLNDADIRAYPAVLCARNDDPLLSNRPSLRHLTTTVVVLPNGDSYDCIDSSIEHSGINVLNPIMIVDNARIVNDKAHNNWVDLTNKSIASSRAFLTGKIDDNGLLSATRNRIHVAADAELIRAKYYTAKDSADFVHEQFMDDNIEIQKYNIEGINDFTSDIKEYIEFTQQQAFSGDHIYINQLVFPLIGESPFKSETRTLPIEMPYKENHNVSIEFTIPDGWEVEELPAPISLTTEDKGFSLKVISEAHDNIINVMCRITNTRLLYGTEEYPALKRIFDEMVKHSKDMIILKRKQ